MLAKSLTFILNCYIDTYVGRNYSCKEQIEVMELEGYSRPT